MKTTNYRRLRPLSHRSVGVKTTQAHRKLKAFEDFEQGWHYGQGVPFSPETLGRAFRIADLAQFFDVEHTDAFPGVDGEIMVTLYKGNLCFEVTAEPDGSFIFLEERDGVQLNEQRISLTQLVREISRLGGRFWKSSGSFIGHITTNTGNALSAWHSDRLPTTGSPLLTTAAHEPLAGASASTFERSMTRESPGTRQFFGSYH